MGEGSGRERCTAGKYLDLGDICRKNYGKKISEELIPPPSKEIWNLPLIPGGSITVINTGNDEELRTRIDFRTDEKNNPNLLLTIKDFEEHYEDILQEAKGIMIGKHLSYGKSDLGEAEGLMKVLHKIEMNVSRIQKFLNGELTNVDLDEL